MAVILLPGRAIPSPASSYSSTLPYQGSILYGNVSSSLLDAQLLCLDSEFFPHSRGPYLPTGRRCLSLCRAAALPQRPFGEQHRSRQDELNSLKQPKHVPSSLESTSAIPLMRSTSLGQSSVWNILSPPSHAPPISFLELHDDALLSDTDDDEAMRRSSFIMVLAICSALQLLYITDAVSLWVTRLRLRYFDSPFRYSSVGMRTKLGRIGIFWDIENCPIPGGLDAQMVVKQMHRIGASFGTVQCLRAYGKLEYLTRQVSLSLLQHPSDLISRYQWHVN